MIGVRYRRAVLAFAVGTCANPTIADAQIGCPAADWPGPPAVESELPWTADSREYRSWGGGFSGTPLGVGHLAVGFVEGGPDPSDWLPHVRVPLFPSPGAPAPTTWIDRGWWIPIAPSAAPRPLTYRGMVETGYEVPSFIVHATRDDGWIQILVDIGPLAVRGASSGLMWTHTCLLGEGALPLTLVLWEDAFVGRPGFTWRDGVRHALRTGPGTEHDRLAWVETDDELELLEIEGEWARVRVTSPGRYETTCLGREWTGQEREGWVKWRDEASGPWVWFPTRGC